MDLELLDQMLADRGEPAFRARQVWAWTARGANAYEDMTDLPRDLRAALARELPFSSLELKGEAHSSDGTAKALFATVDGRPLEAVLMRYRDGRRSICVSSQSGCPLTCTFCATGAMSFARNLSASEILDQALHFQRSKAPPQRAIRPRSSATGSDAVTPITHCVFMGMGEPMLNLDAVLCACERLPDLGIANRRTTISTVGWIPGIERLTECDMPVRLALSLHAAENALRSELMPVNDRYPLADAIEACRGFYARKRRRVFIEYVMLAGVNDRYEQALALARLLRPPIPARAPRDPGRAMMHEARMFKVNLIPYNPASAAGQGSGGPSSEERAPYRGSSRESIATFRAVLAERGIDATVRLTRGRDINAACGQLAATGGRANAPASAGPGVARAAL